MKTLWTLTAALALAGAAAAADAVPPTKPAEPTEFVPKVEGLELVPSDPEPQIDPEVGACAVVVRANTPGKMVRWLVHGRALSITGDKSVTVTTASPGPIEILAVADAPGGLTPWAKVVLDVKPAPKKAAPEPPPAPKKAGRLSGPLNVIVVYDVKKAPPFVAALQKSVGLRDSVEKAGHKLVFLDWNSKALALSKLTDYRDRAGTGGGPVLIIMDGSGTVAPPGPCPETPNGVVSRVNDAVLGNY